MSLARPEACPGAYPGARATRVSFISVITCQGHPPARVDVAQQVRRKSCALDARFFHLV